MTERYGSGPTSDDIDYFPTPNRQLIIEAGRLARAEQARLEQEYRLQDGRTRRPKTDPRGCFSADGRPGRSLGAIPPHKRPSP